MGFKIYTSNRIEELSTIFCKQIKHKTKWNQISNIIVQTKGFEKWLAEQAATNNKIFANYAFSNPDGFIGKIQQLADNYGNSYYSTENIKWKTFTFLNHSEFIHRFPIVANYYVGDDIKRIQLATKIADLFDQYQVYRPTIIEAWNNDNKIELTHDDEDFTKHEAWQRWLWQKLKSESKGRYDTLQLKQSLQAKLESPEFQTKLKAEFPHIHLFGIAVLSNYHWEIYQKLSSFINISVYVTSPSAADDWYLNSSLKPENELLGSCKSLIANLHKLLLVHDAEKKYIPPTGKHLLSTIQSDIYYNHNQGIKEYDTAQADDSLRIVSSYTPVREVEALYNHLLHEFEKNPKLKGNEVSVQLNDVDLYAPLIKAVFDNAPKKIPYIISDQAFSTGDSLIKAVDVFINLHHCNFKAENVLQLLDYKAVRQRFGIDDVEMIREIIADANIRYGIEGSKEDDTYLFSWKHGLSKLILGYAIKGGANYTMEDTDFFPCDAMEGSDALNIFKIKAFAETLFQLHKHSQGVKSIAEWKDYLLNEVFDALFDLDDRYDEELDYIYKRLENLSSLTIDMEELISFQVFKEGLMSLLNSETVNSIYTSGLVTFSSIIPVRSLPYKHIAILGLNAGEFPRQQKTLGFDLMSISPMENDRNIKNNDKYLFLEALLSARDQVYLSYIGSSIKDNSALPPSLLIEELEDYLITGTANNSWFNEKIKYKHPLHASSKVYFEGDKFFTYLGQKNEERIPELNANTAKEEANISFDEINLDDLVNFYKDPFKWYYNKTLRIYYADDAVLLPEEEPFELDHLQKWSLKNELVQLPEENEDDYLKRKKNDGLIQLANMAKAELSIEKEAIDAVKQEYAKYVTGEPKSESINLKFGENILRGKIEHIYDEGQVHYNVSGVNSQPKYLLETYIKHLAYKASNDNAKSMFVSSSYVFDLNKDFIDAAEARLVLKKLIDFYKQGHTSIITFTPQVGLLIMNNIYHKAKPMDKAKALTDAFSHFWYTDRGGAIQYQSDYIAKEASLAHFDLLLADEERLSKAQQQEVDSKKNTLFQLSEILFERLSTLLSIL